MFVRKKKNRSGTTSVVVVDKHSGKFKELHTAGVSNTQKNIVQRVSVEHTFRVLGGRVEMLFYDVTSLYFESFHEDVLRTPGFSKDGKTSETQIILGLLVCENGYPLAYNIFNGAQYESYTMIPIIDDFKRRFGLDDFIVVADSGFMIRRNIELPRS